MHPVLCGATEGLPGAGGRFFGSSLKTAVMGRAETSSLFLPAAFVPAAAASGMCEAGGLAAQEIALHLPGVRLELISWAEASDPDLGRVCRLLPG